MNSETLIGDAALLLTVGAFCAYNWSFFAYSRVWEPSCLQLGLPFLQFEASCLQLFLGSFFLTIGAL